MLRPEYQTQEGHQCNSEPLTRRGNPGDGLGYTIHRLGRTQVGGLESEDSFGRTCLPYPFESDEADGANVRRRKIPGFGSGAHFLAVLKLKLGQGSLTEGNPPVQKDPEHRDTIRTGYLCPEMVHTREAAVPSSCGWYALVARPHLLQLCATLPRQI